MDKIRQHIQAVLGIKDKDMPEGKELEGFSDEQLREAATKAREKFAEARNSDMTPAEKLPICTEASNVALAAESTLAKRVEDAEKAEADLAALDAQINGRTDPEAPEGDEGDGNDDDAGDDDAPEVDEPETPADAPEVSKAPVAVAAAAAPTPAPAPAAPAVPEPSAPPAPKAPPVRLVASADVDGFSPGMTMDVASLSEAYTHKADAVRGKGIKKGTRSGVATAHVTYPEDRTLGRDFEANQAKIDAIVASAQAETAQQLRDIVAAAKRGDEAEITELAAAGGLCAPVNVRYDICQQGSDVRPLRDSLIRFNANRGGIQFVAPPRLSDVAGAANVYTEEQDAGGYDYPKGCVRVECGELVEVKVSAIPLCMEVGNFTNLSYPELFRAWWGYGQVAHARLAEETLWAGMVALSDARTGATTYGAFRSTLNELGRKAAQFRYEYRVPRTTPLRLHASEWLQEVLKQDLTNQMPGDSVLSVSDAQLTAFLAGKGIAVTWVMDGQDPGNEDDPFPSTTEVILSLEGTFLFLDMGRLDFGTEIRDWSQIQNNDVGAFMETFENVAAVCNGPQVITLDICPSGETAPAGTLITCS